MRWFGMAAALLLAGCAATGDPKRTGSMAITSPPVRSGGTGGLIFMPTPAVARLPVAVIGDYNPGPWVIFYRTGTARPFPETSDILDQIAEMAARFTMTGVSLCPVAASGSEDPPALTRRRITALRTRLFQKGVTRIAAATDARCSQIERRAFPMVWIAPDAGHS